MDSLDILHQFSRPATPSGSKRDRASQQQADSGRQTATGSPSLLQRRTISVVDWESKAPLDEEEQASVTVLNNALKTKPLPAKFHRQSDQTLRPTGLPLHLSNEVDGAQNPFTEGSISSSVASLPAGEYASTSVVPQISSAQQFHEHFSRLTSSLSHNQDSAFRAHLAEISTYREACKTIRDELDDAEKLVNQMIESLTWVEERGESLRIAGEDLMQEEADFHLQTQHIASRLEYFTFLEHAQRTLNHPGEDLVITEGFLNMVERLDSCLQYLRSHTDFKDAEVYLIRFQQCMSRSLSLIKIYFVNAVKNLGQEVIRRLTDKIELSETVQNALLYTKFVSLAYPLRPLLADLETRAKQAPSEWGFLLEECQAAWLSVRKSLVVPRVEAEMKRMKPWENHHDLVDLTRIGCSFMKSVCSDEFVLFKQFFQTGDAGLFRFLETLCDQLFEHLRPQILHISSLSTLNDVCTVLQALMVKDVGFEDEQDGAIAKTPGTPSVLRRDPSFEGDLMYQPSRPAEQVDADKLFKILLQDAQARLVFRAEVIMRDEVELYKPREPDLDYPQKIQSAAVDLNAQRQAIAVSLDDEDEEEPEYFALPSKETQETWFPTLRTTLWVLSSLHTFVDPHVFQDLAHEIIATCRSSLVKTASVLSRQPEKRPIDGHLFLIRHLLILKEMTSNVEYARRSKEEEANYGVVQTLSALLAGALNVVGAGMLLGLNPRPRETGNAKAALDDELKRACEDLIAVCVEGTASGLRAFIDRCSLYLAQNDASERNLAAQEWATQEKILQLHEAFIANVHKLVRQWIADVKLYLQDEPTVRVLLPPLHNAILDAYKSFQDIVRSEYDPKTVNTLLGPAGLLSLLRQIELEAFSK